jgi:hypothetical protein
MSGYGPTCRAFVGTFGVADGETIAHPHNCYRSYCPHFSDCGSGYVMPLLAFCHRAEHPVAVFYLIKKEKSQRPIQWGGYEKSQRLRRTAAGVFHSTELVGFFGNKRSANFGFERPPRRSAIPSALGC